MQGIHMGHGQKVDIRPAGKGWELFFSEDGKTNYSAPPLRDIRLETIDARGVVESVALDASDKVSSVAVKGDLSTAARLRVQVIHGSHFHTREVGGPAQFAAEPTIRLSDGSTVAISRASAGRLELTWSKNGEPVEAPSPDSLSVEAIAATAEMGQVRELLVSRGRSRDTLIGSGKVDDAAFMRFTQTTDDVTRSWCCPI